MMSTPRRRLGIEQSFQRAKKQFNVADKAPIDRDQWVAAAIRHLQAEPYSMCGIPCRGQDAESAGLPSESAGRDLKTSAGFREKSRDKMPMICRMTSRKTLSLSLFSKMGT
jgi:hypothetical protein